MRPDKNTMCPRGDSNSYTFRRYPLKIVCLPIPPLGLEKNDAFPNCKTPLCENRRTRTFDPLLKRQLLYQLSYILDRIFLKTEPTSLLLVLVSQALFMTVFTTHFFTLVYRHLMTFSLLSARHRLTTLLLF